MELSWELVWAGMEVSLAGMERLRGAGLQLGSAGMELDLGGMLETNVDGRDIFLRTSTTFLPLGGSS